MSSFKPWSTVGLHQISAIFIKRDGIQIPIDLACVDDFKFNLNDLKLFECVVSEFLSIIEGTADRSNWYLEVQIAVQEGVMKVSQSTHINQILQTVSLIQMLYKQDTHSIQHV